MSGRVLLLALVFTLLNAVKPVTIDDPTYLHFAGQIARSPLDPYGTTWFWYEEPQPANEILAPAVFLYYLAAVLSLVGDNLFLVKLCLFPWAWLLVFAFDRLLTRFAPTVRTPFLVGAVLSPALVPGFNLMLDVPALALGLATVALYLHVQERNSWSGALLVGILLGLAMQTKYTAFVVPGVFLWATILRGGWLLWFSAVGVGAGLFVGWEAYLAAKYGHSHFLLSAGGQGGLGGLVMRGIALVPFFLSHLGGLGCVWLLIALWVLPARRALVGLACALVLAVHLLILLLDARFVNDTRPSPMLFGHTAELREVVQLAEPLFIGLGVAVVAVLGWVGFRLLWEGEAPAEPGEGEAPAEPGREAGSAGASPSRRSREPSLFLLGWLVLEYLGFSVLSPFPAARRLYGFLAVLPLVLARQAERTVPTQASRAILNLLVGFQVALALGYGALDTFGAWTQKAAAERVASWIADHDEGRRGTVWFVGHWGWQFYADRAGMRQLTSIATASPSHVRSGDWLVFPDPRINQQSIRLGVGEVDLHHQFGIPALLPLRTMSCYHGGRTPLEHFEGQALEVRIYRARRAFVPREGEPENFQRGY
jgi:hypothetical protein